MNRESHEGRRSSADAGRRPEDADRLRRRRPGDESAGELSAEQEETGAARQSSSEEKAHKRLPLIVRIVLWILRKSIVPLLLLLALVGGAFLGYVMLGEGDSTDVWKWETWRHLYDLIFLDS
ncbi:DNA-directed RNA polymerase subunit beta [Paenibacillus sp. 1P07SE]|uniref:DNA-directed RNA polymerase subunit beta n=1 Tax=Paenibacillus sp. 1P07SE TaxID=3132209 RepID=UPI0039A5E901